MLNCYGLNGFPPVAQSNSILERSTIRARFGVEAGAKAVYQLSSASKLAAVSSDAKAFDG